MNIQQLLIPKENKKLRPGIKMKPRYITIHETDNTNRGADAFAHARFLLKDTEKLRSWHYTVDDSDIIYNSIPDYEVSWHVDRTMCQANMSSLSIFVCNNKGAIFRRSRYNAIKLTQLLMLRHKIVLGNVHPHSKWDSCSCPKTILDIGWHHFIGELKYELDRNKKVK